MNRPAAWLLASLLLAGAAGAAEPEPDAKAPALVAVVKAVTGTVETRPAVGKPWTPVKEGMTLAEGADLRTGFRARCILDLVDSLAQIDPLTVVRLGELARKDGKVRTRLIMKQGNTQAVVEKERIESDFAIVTPSATLSVRGTQGINAGFFPVMGGSYGLAGPGLIAVRDHQVGHQALCGKGEKTDDTTTPPIHMLSKQFVPVVLPQQGLGAKEKTAASRWNTSTPMPAGLRGSGGPSNTNAKDKGQQKDPKDLRTPSNPTGRTLTPPKPKDKNGSDDDGDRQDIIEPPCMMP